MNNQTTALETLRSHAPKRDPKSLMPVANSLVMVSTPRLDEAIEAMSGAVVVSETNEVDGAQIKVAYALALLGGEAASAGKHELSKREADLEVKSASGRDAILSKQEAIDQQLEALVANTETSVEAQIEPYRAELTADRQRRQNDNLVIQEALQATLLGTEEMLEQTQNTLEVSKDEFAKARGATGLGLGIESNYAAGIGAEFDALPAQKSNETMLYLAKGGAFLFATVNLALVFAEGKPDDLASLPFGLWVATAGMSAALTASSEGIRVLARQSASQIQRFEVFERIQGREVQLGRKYITPNFVSLVTASIALVALEGCIGYMGLGTLLNNQDAACEITATSCKPIPNYIVFGASTLVGGMLVLTNSSAGKTDGINHANFAARQYLEYQQAKQLQADPAYQAAITAEIALQHATENHQAIRADHAKLLEQLRASVLDLAAELNREQSVMEQLAAPTRARLEAEHQRLTAKLAALTADLQILRQQHGVSVATLEAQVEELLSTAEAYTQKLEQLLRNEPENEPKVNRANKPRGFWRVMYESVFQPNRGTRNTGGPV